MEATRSEDTLIFFAIDPKITNIQKAYEAILAFCEAKKTADRSDRFNIVIFQEDGPNYFEDFTLNPQHVMIGLQSLEPTLVPAHLAGGIFVAITFIIDVFKIVSDKCFRLLIITDSSPKGIPEKFIPVVYNLIDQVKDMPFFIDVVRIGVDDPAEDLKLMRFAKRTKGNLYEIRSISELKDTLLQIAAKKKLNVSSYSGRDEYLIPEDSRDFYENMAQVPTPVENAREVQCQICFEKGRSDIVECPKCGARTHEKCWALWSKSSHIGVRNLFRCHNCFNLLKLPEDYVSMISLGKEVLATEIKVLDQYDYLQSLEMDDGPKIIKVEDPFGGPADEYDDWGTDVLIIDDSDTHKEIVPKEKVVALNNDAELKLIWCPSCGKMTSNEFKFCPKCGHQL
jgi:hypothetical protein